MRIFLLAVLCLASLCRAENSPVAETKEGPVQGSVFESANGRRCFAYMGIPYARPPVGKYRFQPPSAPEKRAELLHLPANEIPVCLQYDNLLAKASLGQEDCLLLNVFTHDLNPKEKRDVMVWIHGGGFAVGSSNREWFGPEILMNKDIVMVSINYRVGILGFLSTGDSVISGNFGLKDQVQALRWIKENIHHFGGNPDSITIFGESAGAASVHYLILSPQSKGLFHRAIAQSGSSTAPWALQSRPMEVTKRLADLSQCPTQSSTDLLKCLQEKPGEDIVNLYAQFAEWSMHPIVVCSPVIEYHDQDPFLPENPLIMLKEGNFHPVPLLIGMTRDEGAFLTGDWFEYHLSELTDVWYKRAPLLLEYDYLPQKEQNKISKKILEYYVHDDDLDVGDMRKINDATSDRYFGMTVHETTQFHAKLTKEPVYLYEFTYRGNHTFVDLINPNHKLEYGVSHVDDLQYIFTGVVHPLSPFENGTPGRKMSDIFVDLWTNFAKDGDPTPIGSSLQFDWEPYTADDPRYLDLDLTPEMRHEKHLPLKRFEFWESLQLPDRNPQKRASDVKHDEM